jgi:2-isopropylmalate synthase
MTSQVTIFDTTLRDGEQSPGASMNLAEKVQIAHVLDALGVDVIEAGFPIASNGDFEAVREVARQLTRPTIAGLARCHPKDIERAWEALQHAANPRIHVFLATSAIHRQYKLGMAKEAIIQKTREGVAHAKQLCSDIEFSAEDAARTEPEFLAEVVEAAIAAGATTVNIPDTVGYAMPESFAQLIQYLKAHVSNINDAVISVHCHNDLGMAVANSLAAVKAGARQVECTVNGIGERAGNCSLEEIVMALKTRYDIFGLDTGIQTEEIMRASRTVSSITGLQVQRNKAVVGRNAFAHEAGIHQHGVINARETYEIMRPEDIGLSGGDLVLGKHSGRHAFRQWVEDHGFHLDQTQFEKAFEEFKALADRKKEIFDEDLEAIVIGGSLSTDGPWELTSVGVTTGTNAIPTATVRLEQREKGEVIEEASVGDGPVDALFKAIERGTGQRIQLKSYTINNVTDGKDAQGEVNVQAIVDGIAVRGRANHTDVVIASGEALIEAVNRAAARVEAAEPV